MTSLSRDEKELVFDGCLGLTETGHGIQATVLLAHKEKAAELHAKIRSVLRPLESVWPQACPTGLVERTVQRLCAAAQGVRPKALDVADCSFRRTEDLPPLLAKP